MKKLYPLALCFALLALAACSDNLFGNSSPDKDDSVKSLRIEAENAFRKGDYEKSYNICEMIVKKDSTASFGYYGMARASLWWHGVNPLSIFSLVKPEEDKCPFMGEDARVQNNYFQAMKKIVLVLSKLNRRDSLTALYDSLTDARKNGDILSENLSKFRDTYCRNAQNCRDSISGDPFPLSDREYKRGYFGGILLLSVFTKWFLNFFDMNGDECIAMEGESGKDNPDKDKNASKWEKWGCKKVQGIFDYDVPVPLECTRDEDGNMQVTINPEKILEILQQRLEDYYERVANCTDKCETLGVLPEIENLNKKIDEFKGTYEEVADVLNSIGLAGSGDLEDDQANLKEEIDKYMAYASFYKVGTHIDEDGDGCIDEELLDGLDNDGDGLVNENSRLAPTDPDHSLYGISSMNNSMFGNSIYKNAENWEYNKPVRLQPPVKIYHDPDYTTYTELQADSTGLVTVINFTQKGYPDGKRYWTTTDMDLKLGVAQDTDCTKYNLEYRKQTIGGCWPYYDEKKFRNYYCNRSHN